MEQNTRKTDLRVIKTKAAIKNAAKDLLCEMDPSQITITELTNRAMIHRKTFYLHYASIENLFDEMLNDISVSFFEKMDSIPLPIRMEPVIKEFYEYLANSEPYIEHLLCSRQYLNVIECDFYQGFIKHNRSRYNPYEKNTEYEQNIINSFILSSSIFMYKQWAADGKQLPIADLISLSSKMLAAATDTVK